MDATGLTAIGDPPALVPLFRIEATIGTPAMAMTPVGTRAPVSVTGGRFGGERLAGEVLPGGIDWLLIDAEGTWHVDVYMALLVDDGPVVTVRYQGRIRLPDDGMERILGGGSLAADELYFRTAPTFETEPGPYGWLNSVQAIGVGSLGPGTVAYDVFEVT
jgi:hypothetical protein